LQIHNKIDLRGENYDNIETKLTEAYRTVKTTQLICGYRVIE